MQLETSLHKKVRGHGAQLAKLTIVSDRADRARASMHDAACPFRWVQQELNLVFVLLNNQPNPGTIPRTAAQLSQLKANLLPKATSLFGHF